MRYEIRDKDGNVIYKAKDSLTANALYQYLKKRTGYAEVWYDGECIFKTK